MQHKEVDEFSHSPSHYLMETSKREELACILWFFKPNWGIRDFHTSVKELPGRLNDCEGQNEDSKARCHEVCAETSGRKMEYPTAGADGALPAPSAFPRCGG